MRTRQRRPVRGARDAEATREALLEAAAALFARYGFGGTTVDMIARRARANKAMISYHFRGKEGLYGQILSSAFAEAAGRVQEILDGTRRADERLRGFTSMMAELATRKPHFPAMMVREAMSGGRHMNDRVLAHFIDLFVKVRRVYEQGIEEGTFRPVDPVLTHIVVIGSLVFFLATEPMRARLISDGRLPLTQAPSVDAFVRHLQDLMVRGLAARAPRRRPADAPIA